MKTSKKSRHILAATTLAAMAAVSLAPSAGAVDLRDWGRKMPAKERFVVLAQFNNEAVLDKETQLVWQRYPSNADTWHNNAALACVRTKIGGRMGWRLPTIAELASLVDTASTSAAKLPAGHPFRQRDGSQIPGNQSWWSSTLDRYSPQQPGQLGSYSYYVLHLGTGDVSLQPAPLDRPYICVRGPDAGTAY